MGKPTGFMEYDRENSEQRLHQRSESRILTSSIPLFQKKNREYRQHVVWTAACRSARLV